jgi:hypothetical protein
MAMGSEAGVQLCDVHQLDQSVVYALLFNFEKLLLADGGMLWGPHITQEPDRQRSS